MKPSKFLTLALLLAFSCGSSPVSVVPEGQNSGKEPDSSGNSGVPSEEETWSSKHSLIADGNDEATYDLILSGGYMMRSSENMFSILSCISRTMMTGANRISRTVSAMR